MADRQEAFVATGVISAAIVDAARLLVYGAGFLAGHLAQSQTLLAPVVVATVCTFIRSFVGKRMLQKVTLRAVQMMVVIAMLRIGATLAVGLVWRRPSLESGYLDYSLACVCRRSS